MPKFNLNAKRANRPAKEMFELELDDKVFKIPLGSDILYDDLIGLETTSGQRAFFGRYIPADVMSTLTVADITDIMTAWSEAPTKAAGVSTGESSASRDL